MRVNAYERRRGYQNALKGGLIEHDKTGLLLYWRSIKASKASSRTLFGIRRGTAISGYILLFLTSIDK